MNNKTQKWCKLGLVLKPDPKLWWMQSHAMIPTPHDIGDGWIKLYFSGRNADNQSHIGWAAIDLSTPDVIRDISSEPVLRPGELGCFDDNGVTPSCIVQTGDTIRLYYIGWNPGSTVRMHLFGGLAISHDKGESFERWSRAPIIERGMYDPFLNTAPWVVGTNDGWLMYYVSGVGWVHKDLPRYNIKLARSEDGLTWIRDGHVCIDFADDSENALARPYVLRDGNVWRMWFAYKGESYRLGYAESVDGLNWKRADQLVGLDVSKSGEDSSMMEYAAVLQNNGRRLMYYNGNDYGRGGIMLAVED